jgi:hypothetical protein
MKMTLPRISADVIDATASKVLQNYDKPELFAVETMAGLMRDQPELFAVLSGMMDSAIKGGNELDMVPAQFAQEMMLRSCYVGVGLALNAINAQLETDEMNEAWA